MKVGTVMASALRSSAVWNVSELIEGSTMTAMATATREWLYYVAKSDAGKVLIISRWNGPQIEILNSAGEWVPRPQLLPRFQDPGYLEQVSLDVARETAMATGVVWPS